MYPLMYFESNLCFYTTGKGNRSTLKGLYPVTLGMIHYHKINYLTSSLVRVSSLKPLEANTLWSKFLSTDPSESEVTFSLSVI